MVGSTRSSLLGVNMNNNDTIKYFLYVRKSTDSEDKQMASIDDQTNEMVALADRLGLEIVDTITESRSAKTPRNRPKFNDMVERIQRGEANGILCWKLNRLARNPVDAGEINWMLQEGTIKQIKTYSSTYLPSDNVLTMMVEFGVSNQYVRDLSVDIKRSQRSKAARGWYPASVLPIGYKHNKEYKPGENEILPDSDQFPIVKHLWSLALTGRYSVPDIKREGDKMGLRNRQGNKYTRNAYEHMLTQPYYFGLFYWNNEAGQKVEFWGKHKTIVIEEEFNQVQVYLGKRGRPTRINRNRYDFNGALNCHECGCAVTADRKQRATCTKCKKRFSLRTRTDCPRCLIDVGDMQSPTMLDKTYYHCTKKRGKCSQGSIEETELKHQIEELLTSIEIPEDFHKWAAEALKYMHASEVGDQEEVRRTTKKRETELLKQLDSLVLMKARDEITSEQLERLKGQTENELTVVRKNVEQLHERAVDWVSIANDYMEFAKNARSSFTEGTAETKQGILTSLGSNLVLKDKKLNVDLAKPLSAIKSTYELAQSENVRLEPLNTLMLQGSNNQTNPSLSRLLPDRDSNPNFWYQKPTSYH